MPEILTLLRGKRERIGDSLEIKVIVVDVTDRAAARAYISANAPTTMDGGYILDSKNIELEEYYPKSRTCKGTLHYIPDPADESNALPDPGYSFNYVGGQMTAMEAINTTPYGEVPNDETVNLIHYNRDTHTIDGITLPKTENTVQYTKIIYLRESGFSLNTDLYNLYRYRYHTNNSPWGSWPEDSVLYLGASGNLNNRIWTINYQFSVGANRAEATDIIPGFTINKKAHEYAEAWLGNTKGTDGRVKRPIGVKVHQVYSQFALSLLKGLGS